jgi:hypothetical protein
LKEHLSGKRFNNDDEVKAEVRRFLNSMEVNWYDVGIQNCHCAYKNASTEMASM